MAENSFSILKAKCIYRHKPATFTEANEMIDRYIPFYNQKRIQLKTGEAPLARRLSAKNQYFLPGSLFVLSVQVGAFKPEAGFFVNQVNPYRLRTGYQQRPLFRCPRKSLQFHVFLSHVSDPGL